MNSVVESLIQQLVLHYRKDNHMRFYIKKQLIQNCKFLLEVHKNIRKNLSKIDVNLLIECQQTAVHVGKNI